MRLTVKSNVTAIYVLAAALSLISPALSITLYILIPIGYLFPGTIDKGLRDARISPPPASTD